jgi:hypothetical protein
MALAIVLSFTAGMVWWGMSLRNSSDAAAQTRFTLDAPPGQHLAPGTFSPQFAVSPDGRTLALIAQDDSGDSFLWVRPLNSLSAQRIEGTRGAGSPFWSPDSQFIGFASARRMVMDDSSSSVVA